MRSRTSRARRSWLAAQVGLKLLAVVGARLRGAEAGDPQAYAVGVQGVEQVGQQDDDLGVHGRVVGPDRLRPHLPELAVAARLGRLVAVEARQVPQLHGLGQLVHAVLDVGPAYRRRALGAQGHGAPALVLEGEHLLAHDVRGLPHAAREQLGGLERGRLDAPVPGGLQHLPGLALHHLARVRVVGQHVERAARRLYAFAHWDASSRRNGFDALSWPSVVRPMCPGYTLVSGGRASSSFWIEAASVGQSPPGRSVRPTEP